MLDAVDELALHQQRAVDRVAVAGILCTLFVAASFVALDPLQTVARPGGDASVPQPTGSAAATASEDRPPFARLSLPSPTWSLVTDGQSVAYVRLARGEPSEIVVRSLSSEDWRTAYQAPEGSYVGQLSLADGLLAFEEVASGPGAPSRITVRALRVHTGDRVTLDSYAPLGPGLGESGGQASASPLTDGRRVLWVRQSALPSGSSGDEIRMLDLASGERRTVFESATGISGLVLWRDALAFTLLSTNAPARSLVLDLASGEIRAIDGFAYSQVRSAVPGGVILTGSESASGVAASWLVGTDGTRRRLGSDCLDVRMTERVLAMRCGTQLEIRDLATGTRLFQLAPTVGSLAVADRTVVWADGGELTVYELPALPETGGAVPY